MNEILDEEQEFVERMVRVHVRNAHPEMTDDDKLIGFLQRRKWLTLMLVVNLVIVAGYSYSFYADITTMSITLFYVVLVAFALNVLLLVYQRRQLARAIAYLDRIS